MISHDHPGYHPCPAGFGPADRYQPCAGCDCDTELDERLVHFRDTGHCADCRVNCAICGDWMAGQAEMRNREGRRIHIACEAAAILEAMPVGNMSPAALRAEGETR